MSQTGLVDTYCTPESFNLEVVLETLVKYGAAVTPLLRQSTCELLLEAIADVKYQIIPGLPEYVTVDGELVRSKYDDVKGNYGGKYQQVVNDISATVSLFLEERFRCAHTNLFSSEIDFNYLALLQYPEGSQGMGAHLDMPEYKNLIVGLNLSGEALFSSKWRRSDEWTGFRVKPGDVLLWAGSGFFGKMRGPHHTVTNLVGERNVLTLNQFIEDPK